MPAYLILHGSVADPAALDAYRQAVGPLLVAHGAKRIVRGAKVEVLEGTGPDQPMSILEFPSRGAVQAFMDAPEYQALKQARQEAAAINLWVVDGCES